MGLSKTAFVFPGQEPVMADAGLDLADRSADARSLLARVSERTGVDIFRLLSRGGHDLERPEVMQPTLVAVSMGALVELTSAGVRPDLVAGLSLGEISAWCAAGCISPADAVDVAAARGRIMGDVAKKRPGRLLSLQVRSDGDVEEALALGRSRGVATLVSRNAPDRAVISGDEAALRVVAGRYPSTWLPLPGPWHSPLMEDAVSPVRQILEAVPRRPARAVFVCNRTGGVVDREEDIPRFIAEQISRPLLWTETLRTLSQARVADFVTVGPGKLIRTLIRKNLGNGVRVHRTDDPFDIDETIAALGPRFLPGDHR